MTSGDAGDLPSRMDDPEAGSLLPLFRARVPSPYAYAYAYALTTITRLAHTQSNTVGVYGI
ncbi:hypothetical protein ACF087_36640 [Streptomyces goshikiensis]|uniref:hypothetical protein n=1 Tax=Streptomyces goshikiensis TaxID=1942 RepID=UPI0036FC794D